MVLKNMILKLPSNSKFASWRFYEFYFFTKNWTNAVTKLRTLPRLIKL